jgi:hypothetical protein
MYFIAREARTRWEILAAVVILSLFAVHAAFAQQEIAGGGTTNYIPVFTGSHRIGNSHVVQLGGSTSIGATNERMGTTFQVITDSTTLAQPGQGPAAIFGEASGTVDLTAGVVGFATGNTGTTFGVAGVSFSPAGQGISGNNTSPVGGGGGGVYGVTSASDGGFSFGVSGVALANTGASVGVVGQTFSPNGIGGLFDNAAGGNILVGGVGQPAVAVFRVDGHGTVFADGGFQPSGADFAESMAVTGDISKYAPGDLLVIDSAANRQLALAQQPYSTLVAGIYSTKPGMLGSTRRVGEAAAKDELPLAVVGIVPCNVSAENGPIHVGDLLVTSATPGHAMKGTDRNRMLGAVVGKALESLEKGTGRVHVLVTLQ